LTVFDDLPKCLSYIPGTFSVSPAVSESPTIDNDGIKIKLDPNSYTITFEVIFDSAPAESHKGYNTAYLMDGREIIDQSTHGFWKASYCGFHKYFDIISGDDGDGIIEVGEDIHWAFWITVDNLNYDWKMTDIVVKDRFGAELEYHPPIVTTQGPAEITYSKGKSAKMMLTWWVGDLYPVPEPPEDPEGPTSARLDMEISTKFNPSGKGKQSYTSPGEYEWNSGAVLKFKNPDGIQLSANTGPLIVEVFEQDGYPLP
jgi:hypothetical protein